MQRELVFIIDFCSSFGWPLLAAVVFFTSDVEDAMSPFGSPARKIRKPPSFRAELGGRW